MKKTVMGIIIVCIYCFPFVYFSMYQDFANGSMLGYLLMIVLTSLLAFFGQFFSSSIPIMIGNILSVLSSFYFIKTSNEDWRGFFKPLSPYQLLILVSILNLIPQFLAMKFAKIKIKNKKVKHND